MFCLQSTRSSHNPFKRKSPIAKNSVNFLSSSHSKIIIVSCIILLRLNMRLWDKCPEINRLSSKLSPIKITRNWRSHSRSIYSKLFLPDLNCFLLLWHWRESYHGQFLKVISSSDLVFMHKMSCENISRLFVIYTKKKVLVRKGLTLSNFRVPIRTNSSTSRISINHLHVKSLKPILKNVCGNPKN